MGGTVTGAAVGGAVVGTSIITASTLLVGTNRHVGSKEVMADVGIVVSSTPSNSVVGTDVRESVVGDCVVGLLRVVSFRSFDAASRIATVSVTASAVLLSTKMMSSIVVVLLVDDRDDNDDERAMMFVGAGNTVGLNVSEGANVSEGG